MIWSIWALVPCIDWYQRLLSFTHIQFVANIIYIFQRHELETGMRRCCIEFRGESHVSRHMIPSLGFASAMSSYLLGQAAVG